MILCRHLFHLFLLLCDVFMWVWLDFYFVEVDRAKLCAATAGPRGNLDWSRLGSFSPEIFCAATLLKRKPHNLTLLTKRKQHKTNTLHTSKNVTYKKKNRVKAGSRFFYTDFFLLMVSEIPKATKSKTQETEKIGKWMDVFWISLGLFETVTISIKNLVFQPIVEKFWRDIFLWKENASPHHGPAKISIL